MQPPIPLGTLFPLPPNPLNRSAENFLINPLAMGAKGNRSDKDQVIIQRAIDEAASFAIAYGGGGVVEITRMYALGTDAPISGGPAGRYCIKVPSNVTIQGYGKSTGFQCFEDGATIVLSQGDADTNHVKSPTFIGLTIIGGDSTPNGFGRGIYLMRADDAVVAECDISGTIIGLQCDTPTGDTARNQAPLIIGNRIHDTFWSGGLQTGNGSGIFVALTEGARIGLNNLFNIAEHCIYICDDTSDLSIIGNRLRPLNALNQNCCIQIFTSEAIPNIDLLSVLGNNGRGGKWGILLSTISGKITRATVGQNTLTLQTTNGIVASNTTDLSIVGNIVSEITAGVGIETDAGQFTSITGNNVKKCGLSGIMAFNSPDVVIDGNVSRDNDQLLSTNYGIRIASGSKRARVTNNVACDTQGSPTQAYGIQADADCDDAYIVGNSVPGNRIAAISNLSLNSIERDNFGWNPLGAQNVAVTASPMTYQNGSQAATLYVKGGTVTNIAKGAIILSNGATNQSITLAPNETVTITYTVAPTMSVDRQ